MEIKASGRSALILATGLFVCFAGPSRAVENADNATASSTSENAAGAPIALKKYTKPSVRHDKKSAERKSGKAAKPDTDKKTDATDAAGKSGDKSGENASAPSAMPSSVANANAQQLTTTDTPSGNAAKAMSARANEILQNSPDKPADAQPAADTQVVSADQLNDVDRALHEATPPTPNLALASVEAAAPQAAPAAAPAMAVSNTESTTWDQTSLIGKIFIGFGALLTMASAARMFMA